MNMAVTQEGRTTPIASEQRKSAAGVTKKLHSRLFHFRSLTDYPGQQIHRLFAELYYFDSIHWLAWLDKGPDDSFFYIFMGKFHEAYARQIEICTGQRALSGGLRWKTYARIAARTHMRSSIWTHLLIIMLAVRANIKDDIGNALVRTAQEWKNQYGSWPDIAAKEEYFFASSHGDLFCNAALDFIRYQIDDQSGYRRIMLKIFAFLIPRLKFLWWPVMSRWRRQSWTNGKAQLLAMQTQNCQ